MPRADLRDFGDLFQTDTAFNAFFPKAFSKRVHAMFSRAMTVLNGLSAGAPGDLELGLLRCHPQQIILGTAVENSNQKCHASGTKVQVCLYYPRGYLAFVTPGIACHNRAIRSSRSHLRALALGWVFAERKWSKASTARTDGSTSSYTSSMTLRRHLLLRLTYSRSCR